MKRACQYNEKERGKERERERESGLTQVQCEVGDECLPRIVSCYLYLRRPVLETLQRKKVT